MCEPTPSSSGSISLRPVNPDDAALLIAIYKSTREQELALVSWWTGDQKAAFIQMQSEAQHAHYANRFPEAEYAVVMLDGRAVGRLYTVELDEELRILDLTLLPQERNVGIGTNLLNRLIKRADEGRKALTIHVESFNPSLRLLERLGFRKLNENGIYLLMEHAAR